MCRLYNEIIQLVIMGWKLYM